MPTLSIYVNEKIYNHLAKIGKASAIGKKWIEEKYKEETTNETICST